MASSSEPYPDKHQARFPLTDWADNVQEVSRSIIVQVTGILPEGFPVFIEGEYQACVSGRFLNPYPANVENMVSY